MIGTTTRLLAVASTLSVLASLLTTTSGAARPPGRNPHVDKSAARADVVEDFRALDAVRRFELDGVSLQTPWDAIPGILAGRGYCDLSSRDTRHLVLSFSSSPLECKRPPRPPATGEVIRTLGVRNVDGRRALTFAAYRHEGSTTAFDGADHVRRLRELKALVCRGIPRATQRHDLCPPDTPAVIQLGATRAANVWLARKLSVRASGIAPSIGITLSESP